MSSKKTESRQRLTVTVSPPGVVSPNDWKKILGNVLNFTVPMYLGAFFGQLALGVSLKVAAITSLAVLWGPLKNYFDKLNTETITK